MKIIGITGGVGAGKSEVLQFLKKEFDACICQADFVAKELQKKDGLCYAPIVEHFGFDILDKTGEIDRQKLAEIVFADEKKLQELNQIVHPVVKKQVLSLIEEEKKKGTALFFLEAALLLEDHYDEICDEVWFIYASQFIRRKRLKASRGYSDEKISDMFACQMDKHEFLEKCDRAVDNCHSFEETCVQLVALVEKVLKMEKESDNETV